MVGSPATSIRSQWSKFTNCRSEARSIQAIIYIYIIYYIFCRFPFKTYFINNFEFVS